MEPLYIDEFVELRKSDVDHCVEYIRKKITPDEDTDENALNKLAFQIQDKSFIKVIFDVSKIDFVRDVTKEYLKNFCVPFLLSLGACVFAVVSGENMKNKVYYRALVTEISKEMDTWDIQSEIFDDMNTAREWIADK